MSEITLFELALILPIRAGVYLAKLMASIGKNHLLLDKKHHWPTTVERQEILKNTYYKLMQDKKLMRNSSEQQNHLNAMLHSIQSIDILSMTAKENPLFKIAQLNMLKINEDNGNGKSIHSLVNETDSILRQVTLNAQSRLADIESETAGDLLSDTLQSIGYGLRRKGNNLIGVKGETSIRAQVVSGGRIELDTRSFDGLTCHKELARIENGLKDQGIILRRILNSQKSRRENVALRDPFPSIKPMKDIRTDNNEKGRTEVNGDGQYLRLVNQERQRQKLREY